MPPKKKSTNVAVIGDSKPTCRRRKFVAKETSKVCKGTDIESSSTKEVKPVKRGLKRKLIEIDLGLDIGHSNLKDEKPVKRRMKRKLIQNKIKVNYDLLIHCKSTEDGFSNNKPVAKKRKITRNIEIKPMVTRNGKKCAEGAKTGKDNPISKSLMLNRKVLPKDLKIVRTLVNDYIPDSEKVENTEKIKINTTTNTVDGCTNKIPVIVLEKLITNYNCNKNSSNQSEKTVEDDNVKNTISDNPNCEYNLEFSSNTTSAQDVSPIGSPCHESALDKLCLLDHYKSRLHQFTGYSYENNVDLSRKKLHVTIQTQELKSVTCGGVFPTTASSSNYNDKESISVNADEDKYNVTNEQNTKDQILETDTKRVEFNYVSPHRFNCDEDDDDDTISLFAESLSGFESNPKISYVSNLDKFEPNSPTKFKIPKPVVPKPCVQGWEKQKADSTSGLLEVSSPKLEPPKLSHIKPESKIDNHVAIKAVKHRIFSPDLSGFHSPVTLVKSAVFKGICVFNIMKNCKNSICNFPHTVPSVSFVREKLSELTQDHFHQECLMVCKKAELLRLYGLEYIMECIRRNKNRMLIEITLSILIAFENTQEEKQLITESVEWTLLYLNQVNLTEITDLLSSEFKSGVQVCDKFLEVLGQTQNFSRFKVVFVKLTIFMCRQNRTFNSDTVSQILERVCILPYSYDLARALVDIMKRTGAGMFRNSMVKIFEQKLLTCDEELLQEFVRLKNVALSNHQYKRLTDDSDRLWNVGDRTIRYSPDTTNKDIPDKNEHVAIRKPDHESQQSTPRRSLLGPHPHANWGSPAPMNQLPKNPYRLPVHNNYWASPTLSNLRPHQMKPRQRGTGSNWVEPPRPRKSNFPLQNIRRTKSNGPYI